ncbi:DNA polymerase II large subunit [Candidatus Woesearchaeota archaeon]|nr:DNA polymerase II large subunit [Candidatus Woesearchaeota archaeon]
MKPNIKNEASPEMEAYFGELDGKLKLCYASAQLARLKGHDPEPFVDIPLAKNLAERVEGLVSAVAPQLLGSGVAARIQELEGKYGALAWEVALIIAEEVASEKFCKFKDWREALEMGIRTGFAYHTTGVVSAPLEGFIELKIKKRKDGKDYLAALFAGPIRGAGGTAAAFCLVIADYLRKKAGFDVYDPDEQEVKRFVAELDDYHERVTNLQYKPGEEEISFLVRNCPIEVDGDPTERFEVSNYKDLPRVGTNRIRGGMCLVVSMLAFKAPKLWKEMKRLQEQFSIDWSFLEKFMAIQKKKKSMGRGKSTESKKLEPDFTFISDLVAGRPVITHPLRHGGLRLRYGKTRASGYSAAALSPATMVVLDRFIATGTQLKLERPGKAASITPCDSIDGPVVRLLDGSVLRMGDDVVARQHAASVAEVLYLGDILVSYGDFYDRVHVLVPPGYCEEWFAEEVKKKASEKFGEFSFAILSKALSVPEGELRAVLSNPFQRPSAELALALCESLAVPVHPFFTYFWSAVSPEQLVSLISLLLNARLVVDGKKAKLVVPVGLSQQHKDGKRALELIGLPHLFVNGEFVVIEHQEALSFLVSLGINIRAVLSSEETSKSFSELIKEKLEVVEAALVQLPSNPSQPPGQQLQNGLELVRLISLFPIRDKAGTFIGARMGRPEKAKMRRLTGSPQVLFPVGDEGGRLRSFQEAISHGKVVSDFPIHYCPECKIQNIYPVCGTCGGRAVKMLFCGKCGVVEKCVHGAEAKPFSTRALEIGSVFDSAMKALGEKTAPDLIKGVRGTSNRGHIPENLAKGVLRAKHELCVNKDGTVRYDMSELPLTHFTPSEIRTPVKKLVELGYTKDVNGAPLVDEHQLLELKPQDLVLPTNVESNAESSYAVLFRVAKFVDDLLARFYKQEPFYCLNSKEDLVGHLVLCIAPHISAAIVGRIIGFSSTQGFFAHPLFHAAMRRDADGDEASVSLVLDALLNFSRQFLPDSRGAKTMDSPLVLTSRLIPAEVDDMAHRFDVAWSYPLEFYEAALQWKQPQDVKVELLGSRIGTPGQYEGMGFTHKLSSINAGVTCSAYKTLPSMEEKLKGQMVLAERIRAVDAQDVARLVIEKHLLKDVRGNLRKFSTQQFRCLKCNTKFRRPPLIGSCNECGGKILFTISEGSIIKYLEPAISLAEKYAVSPYLLQVLDLTKKRVEAVFGREKEKQEGLGKWFG